MADLPTSFGSGKPTISRVPEGGGGAFRPRPVPGATKAQDSALAASAKHSPEVPHLEAVSEHAPNESALEESALWARLAAVNARRKALKDRSAQWSREGVGGDG
jgi:hypothetical protein